MRVGEVSGRTGVSVRSIRHYERAGLLAAARGRNGYREFDEAVVERVGMIRDLIGSGFTVAEIQSLSACLSTAADDCGCCTRTVALYREKLAKIEAQVRALTLLQARIRQRIGALEPC
jgi:DNA-binding transcriptional MerR regulator